MVSDIGLGTYPLSGASFTKGSYWEGPNTYGHVSAEEAKATILYAIESGLNFIDTAPVYGQSEAVIGDLLDGAPDGVIVETKAGEYVAEYDVLTRDFTEAQILRSVAESKRLLRTDVIDIVLLHSPTAEEFGDGEPLDLLCRLRDNGQVRYIGVSVGNGPEEAIQLIRTGKVDVLQVEFNLLRPQMALELLPLAKAEDIGIVVRVPLASGFLTGRIKEDHVFADDDYRSKTSREAIVRGARRAKEFKSFVRDGVTTLPELALRYILSFDGVSTIIAGAMNREELKRNLAVSDKGPLQASQLDQIRALQQKPAKG
jgi:aryl-alcohol dehydrogenase-like predicted oxidoreductase